MDISPQPESSASDRTDPRREIIRKSLDEIVQELEVRMREAGLSDPVFLTVPSSGQALMTMATPADPNPGDWNRIIKIICVIVSGRLDGMALRSMALPCAMVSATPMNAADVIVD
jgi:hypothetical protein